MHRQYLTSRCQKEAALSLRPILLKKFSVLCSCKTLCILFGELGDFSLLTGNHNWVGSDFAVSAGVGLVVKMNGSVQEGGATILGRVTAAFERDWTSRYAKSLHGNRDLQGRFRNLDQAETYRENHGGNEWNRPLFV